MLGRAACVSVCACAGVVSGQEQAIKSLKAALHEAVAAKTASSSEEAKDLKEFIEAVDPEALKKGGQQGIDFHLVQCNVGLTGDALPCEEVATVYAGAVKNAPEQFMIQSLKAGDSKPTCQGIYTNKGKLVRELREGESPTIPGQ